MAQSIIDEWRKNDPSIRLNLSHLGLDELPDIPIECVDLDCSSNKLKILPKLPNCVRLQCSYNILESLPELPKCEKLMCSYNKLKILPELPNCKAISCMKNQLTELPMLLNAGHILCSGNNIVKFPEYLKQNCSLYIGSNLLSSVNDQMYKCRSFNCNLNPYLYLTKFQRRIADRMWAFEGVEFNKFSYNYNIPVRIIQKAYHWYKRVQIFKKLHENYIKNVSTLISLYVC